MNSGFTVALVLGMSVSDTSENAIANLGWEEILLPHPVFVGDTLWGESLVVAKRESESRPYAGIVTFRHELINQRDEIVCECKRVGLMLKRPIPAAEAAMA